MAEGTRLLAAIIASGSSHGLLVADPEHFTPAERPAYDFIRAHYRRHHDLPRVETVQEETGIRLPSIRESLGFYQEAFLQRAEFNIFREAYGDLRQRASEGGQGMGEVKARVARLHRDLNRVQPQPNVSRIDDAMADVMDDLAATRGYGGITGIETGWPTYDSITGGYQDTDLITIVGRMGQGKTYVLLKQADYAHQQGANVLFITTEMGNKQIARRYLSIGLGINPHVLKTNQISTYTQRRIQSFYRDMVGADRFNLFSVGTNSKVDAIEAFAQEFGPTVIWIDGGYLLKPVEGHKSMNRIERITQVWNELLALKTSLGIPIIVTSQFNRQAGKGGKDGSLETVAFSDAIGMNSALVVGLTHGTTDNPRNSRRFDFLKGREGEEGQVEINFKFAPLDMSEITPEQAEAEGVQPAVDMAWMQ